MDMTTSEIRKRIEVVELAMEEELEDGSDLDALDTELDELYAELVKRGEA